MDKIPMLLLVLDAIALTIVSVEDILMLPRTTAKRNKLKFIFFNPSDWMKKLKIKKLSSTRNTDNTRL